jgi:hypothetical protein
MGTHRASRLKDLEAWGLEYAPLGPTSDDLGQSDLINERIVSAST